MSKEFTGHGVVHGSPELYSYVKSCEIIFALELTEDLPISWIFLSYTYLHSDKKGNSLLSKYALDYLRHQFLSTLELELPFDIMANTKLSFEERLHQRHYFLWDIRFSKVNDRGKYEFEYFVDVTNILNTSYNEISDVPMPGRWIETGIKVRF